MHDPAGAGPFHPQPARPCLCRVPGACKGQHRPVDLKLDGTGLELFGPGEWCAAKHGRLRRRWLELHLGVDAGMGEIAAHVLTDGDEDDAAVADLRFRCAGSVAKPTASRSQSVFACRRSTRKTRRIVDA